MNKKNLLPLGTICEIKGHDFKIMIIGYNKIEYNEKIEVKEYIGTKYPEGVTFGDKLIGFNNNEIVLKKFYGFHNKDFEAFYEVINDYNKKDSSKNNIENEKLNLYKFDDKGNVIDDTTAEIIDVLPTFYKFDEKGNVIEDLNVASEIKTDFSFNANGVVTEDKTPVAAPVLYKFDENGNVVEDLTNTNIETKPQFTFDANGVVLSEI